jgi:hypothetical protein
METSIAAFSFALGTAIKAKEIRRLGRVVEICNLCNLVVSLIISSLFFGSVRVISWIVSLAANNTSH